MISIFDISGGRVVINPNCLLIPELKKINEKYEDPLPALCFIHFITDPKSPYFNLPEDSKEESVMDDYPGDYTTEDPDIIKAVEKLNKLYETPSMHLYKSSKGLSEKLARYFDQTDISEGRDGNLTAVLSHFSKLTSTMENLNKASKIIQEELGSARGGQEISFDLLDDDDD
jgi:hypothetical protein